MQEGCLGQQKHRDRITVQFLLATVPLSGLIVKQLSSRDLQRFPLTHSLTHKPRLPPCDAGEEKWSSQLGLASGAGALIYCGCEPWAVFFILRMVHDCSSEASNCAPGIQRSSSRLNQMPSLADR